MMVSDHQKICLKNANIMLIQFLRANRKIHLDAVQAMSKTRGCGAERREMHARL